MLKINNFQKIISVINKDVDSFSREIGQLHSEEEIMQLLVNMIIPIARNGFLNEERKLKLFYECEKLGVHILPTHFYNTTPNTCELTDEVWGGENENGGFSAEPVNFDLAECKDLIHNLEKFSFELSDITNNKGSKDFYWNNPAIGACDASIYYSMIRYFKPKHCIEIGSGYSTLLAARAAKLNNTTEFEAIEPYPFEWLEQIENLSRLTKSKIQDVPLEYFDKLEENDILFVDNSHVCKVGSDVNHIILALQG